MIERFSDLRDRLKGVWGPARFAYMQVRVMQGIDYLAARDAVTGLETEEEGRGLVIENDVRQVDYIHKRAGRILIGYLS